MVLVFWFFHSFWQYNTLFSKSNFEMINKTTSKNRERHFRYNPFTFFCILLTYIYLTTNTNIREKIAMPIIQIYVTSIQKKVKGLYLKCISLFLEVVLLIISKLDLKKKSIVLPKRIKEPECQNHIEH